MYLTTPKLCFIPVVAVDKLAGTPLVIQRRMEGVGMIRLASVHVESLGPLQEGSVNIGSRK